MSLTCHIAMSQCLTQKEPVKYTSKLILGINLHPFDCLVTNNFLCLSSTKRNIVSLPAEKRSSSPVCQSRSACGSSAKYSTTFVVMRAYLFCHCYDTIRDAILTCARKPT